MAQRVQLTSRGVAALLTNGTARNGVRLLNGVRTHRLKVTIRAQVQITGAGGTIRNRGSAAALVSLFLNENGRDRCQVDGRVASHLTQCYAPSTISNERLTSAAIATYNIVERVVLHFAAPNSVRPSDATYTENDLRSPIELQAIVKTGGLTNVLTGGTATLNSVSIEVEQDYVPEGLASVPFFVPTIREQVENINAVSSAWPVYLKTPHRLRGVVITQDSDTGEVSDIISSLVLRGDSSDIIGPNPVTYDNLVQQQEELFGGSVFPAADATSRRSHLFLDFARYGRLSHLLFPQRDHTNLRFELGTTVSAAANPRVRFTYLEMERPAPQGTDGRVIVTPDLPRELA